MDIPIISHYSRLLNVPISKAFQYYSDVESSQIRYPDYCMKVEIVGEAPDNSIRTKGLWNISLSNDIDHIVAYITYTFLQPTVLTLIGIGIGALKFYSNT
jgi:hypothetical protein